MGNAGAASVAIGGSARVYCVHNKEKRKVTELPFDPVNTSVHLCSCCENLFLEQSDTPMFCHNCRRSPTYAMQGSLPDPLGRI